MRLFPALLLLAACTPKPGSVGETGDSAAETGTDTSDTGNDTSDTTADTSDTGADTGDTATDTSDSGVDTGDSGVDTADSGVDTGDSGLDTGDSGAETGETGDTGLDTASDDADHDGYLSAASGGDDCDDLDATVNPGAAELCNDRDDDCDGTLDDAPTDAPAWYLDDDGDTYGDSVGATTACVMPSGYVANADDCDDNHAGVNPAAEEICNGVDDNCDRAVDAADATGAVPWYADSDGDTYGDSRAVNTSCTPPPGYIADGTDCDDRKPLVHPGATEVCDALDNDCDGTYDVGAADATTWYVDGDGDSYGDGNVAATECEAPPGYITNGDDCDDRNPAIFPTAVETCNGVDDNCDRIADGADATGALTFYMDADGDTFGDPDTTAAGCSAPRGFLANSLDCDDTSATTFPGAREACDGMDNDCDGVPEPRVFLADSRGRITDLDALFDFDNPAMPAFVSLAVDSRLGFCADTTFYVNILVTGATVEIGGYSRDGTVLDGAGLGTVLNLQGGADVQVADLTLAHGQDRLASGLLVQASSATLTRTVIRDHSPVTAVYLSDAATLDISDSALRDNTASSGSGVFYVLDSTVTFTDSMLTGNISTGPAAGAVQMRGSAVVDVSGSDVSGNAGSLGGAFGLTDTAQLTITDSTISGNTATLGGGAIWGGGGTLTVSDSVISGNTSMGTGGGFDLSNTTTLLTADQIFENVATTGGGGLYLASGTTSAVTCDIYGNAPDDLDVSFSVGSLTLGYGASFLYTP